MPVVGFLNSTSPEAGVDRLRGFRQGLKDTGYVEGENVAIEYRWAENQLERLPVLAAELIRRQVAVIVAAPGGAWALAAKAAIMTIPIVFVAAEDPVRCARDISRLHRPIGCRKPCRVLSLGGRNRHHASTLVSFGHEVLAQHPIDGIVAGWQRRFVHLRASIEEQARAVAVPPGRESAPRIDCAMDQPAHRSPLELAVLRLDQAGSNPFPLKWHHP